MRTGNRTTPDPWLSVTKAAKRLRCATQTVYAMVARGELPYQVVDTRVFVSRESVEATARKQRISA